MKRAKIYPKISADSIHRLSRFIRSIESAHMIHRADCLFSPSTDNSTRGLSPCAKSIAAFTIQTGETIETDINIAGVYIVRADNGRYLKKLALK